MKKKLVILVNILLSVLLLAIPIYAWLVETKETEEILIKSGKVEYLFQGEFESGLIVPGQNLIKNHFIIENKSSVDSQLRVKIEITLDFELLDIDDERLIVTLGDNSDFVLRDDVYYYYKDLDGIILANFTEPITILKGLSLNGYLVSNEYSHKDIQIKISIEAKQADHVTWNTLLEESIDFESGT